MKYSIKDEFDLYYNTVYNRWRVKKEKAGKDIVGEEYEKFRKNFYKSHGFTVEKELDIFGSGVNPDNVVKKNNNIILIEEDKGSYLDGTFLKRALVDAATIFSTCLEKNIKCPYFILSCTTKMKNYENTYNKVISLFNDNLKKQLNSKFMYLPLCNNGRVSRNTYFKTEKNHFVLSDECIEKQQKIINKIKCEI